MSRSKKDQRHGHLGGGWWDRLTVARANRAARHRDHQTITQALLVSPERADEVPAPRHRHSERWDRW